MWKGRSNPQRFYLLTLLTLGCVSFAVLVSAARAAPASSILLLGIALAFIVTSSFGVRVETSTPNSVVIFNVSDGVFVFALLTIGASSIYPLLVVRSSTATGASRASSRLDTSSPCPRSR